MRRALIPAFLLLLGSAVLGATVLREPIARAATPFTNVIVGNDSSHPVPVHEQATADVNVTNSSLPIAPAEPVTGGGGGFTFSASWGTSLHEPGTATGLNIHMSSGVTGVAFYKSDNLVAFFWGPFVGAQGDVAVSLRRPITWDRIECQGDSPDTCAVGWVGNEP